MQFTIIIICKSNYSIDGKSNIFVECSGDNKEGLIMGFWETAGKVADAALKGTAYVLETGSRSASRSNNFTKEQRQELRDYSERMGDIRENGFSSSYLSSDDDDY